MKRQIQDDALYNDKEEKKTGWKGWLVALGVLFILFVFGYVFLIMNVSNIGREIKCPTYPVDYEYEGIIKAEYKSLVLIDGTYSSVDWNSVYDGCYYSDEENKLVCPNGYNSGAWLGNEGEFVLDMEEDNCYYVDSDVSMLKTIYKEKHRD